MGVGTPCDELMGWHFLQRDGYLRYLPYMRPKVGKKLAHDGPLELYVSGLHACVRALDAVEFAPGPRVCRVKLSGGIVRGIDQACARERTVLWMTDASRVLQEFAWWCAAQAVDGERRAGREPDARTAAAMDGRKNALETKKAEPLPYHFWTNGWKAAWEISDRPERNVAWHATWFAAEAAAEAATWQAPWLMARAAASAAAKSIAYQAVEDKETAPDRRDIWQATWQNARESQNKELERLLNGLA